MSNKRTVRLTTANDRKLIRLCEETGLDINGIFNLAIADLATARGIKGQARQIDPKMMPKRQ
jgi:hypothetical protein